MFENQEFWMFVVAPTILGILVLFSKLWANPLDK
jgi:hypothetical protein